VTASNSPVLHALSRRMLRDGIYWLPYHELDSRLLSERPSMKAAERDEHFHDLYLAGWLRRRGDGADAITLAGYRAASSGADRDFNALLVSLRRLAPERSGYLVRVSFEEICRDSRHFYPEDLDCKPQWVHSLLMLLGVAPENMPSEGPWDLLASEVRVAVECQTVEEFLDASAASKRREKRFAAVRQVRDYAGSTVVGALHDDIAEGALERWQLGQFSDAVQACLHVVHKAVEAKAGVKCAEDVPNLLLTVFSTRNDDNRAESKGFKACGSIRLRLPGSEGKGDLTQKNRQDALRHLAVGFQKGIRNPRSHEPRELNEVEALEILCLASLVLRLIDECEVVDLTVEQVGEA
jgi:hypothetical protein